MPLPITVLQGLPTKVFLDLLRDDAMKVTYSQMGEDIVVYYLLTTYVKKQTDGFYVDIGAYHPRLYSNTKFLTFLGWRGINVDASEEAIASFRQERPQDTNVCCGVACEDGELLYYRFAGGAPNTFSAEIAERWQNELGWKLESTERLPVRSINSILEEHLPAGQEIDCMDIDVEGLDRDVTQSIDLARYRPKILIIELHGADRLRLGEDPTVAYLVQNGYELMSANVTTYVFMDRSFLSQ